MAQVSLSSRVRGSILLSLLSDAYALGFHWVYDTSKIKIEKQKDGLIAPESPYQKTKKKGQFTHYGDQSFALLKSVSSQKQKRVNLEDFCKKWRQVFEDKNYNGYIDGATKNTLANIKTYEDQQKPLDYSHIGSNSSDFSAVGRFAPILLRLLVDTTVSSDLLVQDAIALTKLTHNKKNVLQISELFTRATLEVIAEEGRMSPLDALNKTFNEHRASFDDAVSKGIEKGFKALEVSKNIPTNEVIKEFGQACSWDSCLPSSIYLIGKYGDDIQKLLEANSAAGGDNAARGMAIGAILGAYYGEDEIPSFIKQMESYEEILSLLKD